MATSSIMADRQKVKAEGKFSFFSIYAKMKAINPSLYYV